MIAPLRIALVTLLFALPAQAQDQSARSRIETGTNLFCETQQQVERFMTHFGRSGGNAEAAISAVNGEVQDQACVIATATYRLTGQVSTIRDDHAVFDVMQIIVVGVYTLNGFEYSLATEYFTLSPRDEDATVGRRP